MLNYNKIHSSINFERTAKRQLAEYLGIPESTLRSRLEKENFTPDDIEKIADYFGKPIAYYFDREESKEAPILPGATQVKTKPYAQQEQHNIGTDPKLDFYTCPECIEKQREINDLRKLVALQDKLIAAYEGKKKSNGTSG